jgi:hypothetical protein
VVALLLVLEPVVELVPQLPSLPLWTQTVKVDEGAFPALVARSVA